MDFRKFAKFLTTMAVGLLILGGSLFAHWKQFPQGMSAEASHLRGVVVGTANLTVENYVSRGEARIRLDRMYAADEARPQYVDFLLIAAAAVGLLGVGMLVSSKSHA